MPYLEHRKLSSESSSLLDFVRGGAAQLVVIGHGISFTGIAPYLKQPNFPWMQNIAVLVFFIISGFLITYSLIGKAKNDNYQYFDYLVDRSARIYTTFLPSLVFVFWIDLLSISLGDSGYRYWSAFDVKTFVGNIFLLQDFPGLPITSFGSARPFWTLAMEWWIYLFVGAVFFFIVKTRSSVLLVCGIVFSVVPLYNLLGGRGNGLFSYWLFGSVIYFFWASRFLDRLSVKGKVTLLFLGVVLASYRVMDTLVEYEPIFAMLLAINILLLIDLAPRLHLNKAFSIGAASVAAYSYTLYLVHYSIYDFMVTHWGQGVGIFVVGFVASNLVAMGMGYFFEERGARFVKEKFYRLVAS
ncbi:acyltransferase [uncultured Marinobacter sp.]|uniref:acyltransferase family protein n=1 Tax=uncultured Marinobacter sp. TaxID=187379 RepID=UPI00260FA1DB|nr:acyltransferase [uncultured Marinobacter sp.]